MEASTETSAAGPGRSPARRAMDPEGRVCAAILTGTRELSNLRFLVEQQLRAIDELDRRGLDGREARELLARLMRRHEDIRTRPAASNACRAVPDTRRLERASLFTGPD